MERSHHVRWQGIICSLRPGLRLFLHHEFLDGAGGQAQGRHSRPLTGVQHCQVAPQRTIS